MGLETNERAVQLRLMPLVLRDYGDPAHRNETTSPAKEVIVERAVDAIGGQGLAHTRRSRSRGDV